jgi:hypothetical protein
VSSLYYSSALLNGFLIFLRRAHRRQLRGKNGLTNSRKAAVASHSASPYQHALSPISSRGAHDTIGDGARKQSVKAEMREARGEGEMSIAVNRGGDRRSRSRMREGRARGEEAEGIVGSALPPTPTFGAKNWLARSPRRSKRTDKG